jgi:metal-responsive CopG/Arc/MetJ family transcriptional regulator
MKAVQFTIDDELLHRIDSHPATKQRGRSAFLREAAAEFLRRHRAKSIRDAYKAGYQNFPPAADEFFVAPEAQAWPDE